MTIAELQDFRQHAPEIDRSTVLGSIVWSTVRDTAVKYDVVKARLQAVGLDKALPPSPPCDADVFRRTFQNGQRRQYKRSGVPAKPGDPVPTIVENLLVRDVKRTGERLVKRIVVEEVDADGERLSYEESLEVVWTLQHPAEVAIRQVGRYNHRANQLARDLAGAYSNERGCLDGNGVRRVIMNALGACNATCVREGGAVYFVTTAYDKELAALEELARNVPGATVHSLPLVDDRKQRDMVRESFLAEVTTDVERQIVELVETLKAGEAISPRKFQGLQSRYNQLRSKVEEYQGLLQDNLDTSELRLDLLRAHMKKALSSVAS